MGHDPVFNWCVKKYFVLSLWLQELEKRTRSCKVTVAVANKLARVMSAVMANGQSFDLDKVCKAG